MPNELPKQLYITRFVLKDSAVFDMVSELTEEEIEKELIGLYDSGRRAKLLAVNEQGWPVVIRIEREAVLAFIHSPYKQYLAGRPNLSVQ